MNIPSKLSFEVDFSSPLISLPGLNLFVSSFLSYFLFEIWDFFLKNWFKCYFWESQLWGTKVVTRVNGRNSRGWQPIREPPFLPTCRQKKCVLIIKRWQPRCSTSQTPRVPCVDQSGTLQHTHTKKNWLITALPLADTFRNVLDREKNQRLTLNSCTNRHDQRLRSSESRTSTSPTQNQIPVNHENVLWRKFPCTFPPNSGAESHYHETAIGWRE